METLTKNIIDIVIAESKLINENITGLNFLEKLKITLISQISPFISDLKFPLDKFENIEKELKIGNKSLKILIKYYLHSSMIRKKTIETDTLFLFFNESANFDIYKDHKNFVSILLYKNTGLSLSKKTEINSKFNSNLIAIEIQNKNNEEILTK